MLVGTNCLSIVVYDDSKESSEDEERNQIHRVYIGSKDPTDSESESERTVYEQFV